MKIYRVKDILEKLEYCITHKLPFSHIRFGDGGLKYMHSVLYKSLKQLNIIIEKEGIPEEHLVEVLELWGYYGRRADFIDCPDVYFSGDFWPRIKTSSKAINPGTKDKLSRWKRYYYNCEIDNENYCNPESNYLMTLRLAKNRKNILDVMRKRKVCIITAKPGIKTVLKSYSCDVDVVEIVGHYENQYKQSFNHVVEKIKEDAKRYDFWLVAAGELGRIYSGLIKENGGRTIDIGFVIEFWLGEELHERLEPFMERSKNHFLETVLLKPGIPFKGYI